MPTVALVLVVLMGSPRVAEETAQSLVEKAASRYSALTSCRMSYLYEPSGKPLGADGKEVKFTPTLYSFSGDDWTRRTVGGITTFAEFEGVYFEYAQGRVLLRDENPRTTRVANDPPVWAGSFWYAEQAAFVKEHSREFRLAGTETVGGVETKICEMVLSKELAGKGFHSLTRSLVDGGTLRLYIAPQLGHVLPVIEFIDFLNTIQIKYEASSFSYLAPNLWLPGSIRRGIANQSDQDMPLRYSSFTGITYELVNEPIPKDDFVIKLKPGNRVEDRRRTSGPVWYTVQEECTTGDLIGIKRD